VNRLILLVVVAMTLVLASATSASATALDTTITSGPSGVVSTTSATFNFSSNIPHTSFDCALDSGSWSLCSTPRSYTNLANGPHTFRVRARLLLLVDTTPATRAFTVDTVAPTVSITSPVEDGDGDVDIALPTGTVASLGGGAAHMCAVLTNGDAKCWGWNAKGQLGDATTVDRASPVDVIGLHNVADIAGGQLHTCARLTNGTVSCWGTNSNGELGDGTTVDRPAPTAVSGLSAVTQLTVGDSGGCALDSAGTVRCWGRPFGGSTPTVVGGFHAPIRQIVLTGSNLCAVTTANAVECVGNGYTGEFGSLSESLAVPTVLPDLASGVKSIRKPYGVTCALMLAGGVKCSGFASFGQIGDGSTVDPRQLPSSAIGLGSEVTAISGGFTHSCVLINDGSVKCWGNSGYGIALPNPATPSTIPGLTAVTSLTGYGNGQCALRASGPIVCIGSNQYGTLGNGTFGESDAGGVSTLSNVLGLSTSSSGAVDVSVTFTVNDATSVTTKCSVDNAAYTACSSPLAVNGLGAGAHTISVRATDAAGNTTTTTVHISVNP
jgi:alpha-tubulin suppressor-like RCC1 family protein